MIQVILVDDELWVRNRIRGILDWEAQGYNICAEFSDGLGVMEYLERNYEQVQILITDVIMTKMNGDKLVEQVHKRYPDICIIVLSGYDDYRYVRDTLKNGALDYLVKNNLTQESLLEVLSNAKDQLKHKLPIIASTDNVMQLRGKFAVKLVTGYYSDIKLVDNMIRTLDICLDRRNTAAVLLILENGKEKYAEMTLKKREMLDFSVRNIVEEILLEERTGVIGSLENGRFVIILSCGELTSQVKIEQKIRAILNRISFCINNFLNWSVDFVVGSIGGVTELEQSFQKAEEKGREHFFQKKGTILFVDQINTVEKSTAELKLSLKEEQLLQKAVLQYDLQEAIEIIDRIFSEIQEQRAGYSDCARLFNDLLLLAGQICRKNGLDLQEIYGGPGLVYEILSKLEKLEDFKNLFRNIYRNIILEMASFGDRSTCSEYTVKAIQYMKKNFRSEMSQTEIAGYLGITPAYLSTTFKKDVGIGCKEYLLNLRLEESRMLMDAKQKKLKEIVELSGFSNYSYFFKQFKQRYGMTPKEYMKDNL